VGLREDIAALHELSEGELEWWCRREGDDRYGTWASVIRALTWLRRGAREPAIADLDRALAKTPCFEWLELGCALLLFTAREHGRALELLDTLPARHRRLAGPATKLAAERRARLAWAAGQRAGPVPPTAHDHDGRDLAHVASLILRALGRERGTTEDASGPFAALPGTRVDDGRALSSAEIERFMTHGFIRLRRAFAPEIAAAMVADAERRMQREPAAWVSPRGELRAEDLDAYVPDDPATWPRGRLDLRGPSRTPIASLSPYLDRAIDQLLRGCARATRVWSDALIIQFPSKVSVWRPRPSSPTWHLDSPSEQTRLDKLHTGLLSLVLYSDLRPNSGNTWICPDSVPAVARTLAAAPEGVDFCDPNTAPKITARCRRFEQITGEAGDVFLLHPLILHSASPNPSPRIRWASNPMVYLDEALDPWRAEASPVEAMIARALAPDPATP